MELNWFVLNLSCNDIHKGNGVDTSNQPWSLNPFHVHTQVWVSVLLESHNKSDILVNHPWLTSLLYQIISNFLISITLGHQKGSFQNEVQIGIMISIVIFTVFVSMVTGLPLFMENKRIILSWKSSVTVLFTRSTVEIRLDLHEKLWLIYHSH